MKNHTSKSWIKGRQAVRDTTRFSAWGPGDQRYYVSDTSKLRAATGWTSKVDVQQGVGRLHDWLKENVVQSRRKVVAQPALPGRSVWVAEPAALVGDPEKASPLRKEPL